MKKILGLILVVAIIAMLYFWWQSASHVESPTADVFIMQPGDNSEVTSPVKVVFGATNVNIVAAGIDQPNSGHHHLLINLDEMPDLTQALPVTEQIIHFGGGQKETEIELPPGTHSLQLLLGDYLHKPHFPPIFSKKIHVTVVESE